MTISTTGVIGAGIMGTGIVQSGLAAGLRLIMYDTRGDAVAETKDEVLRRLGRLIAKGKLPDGLVAVAETNLILASSL